MNHKLCDFSSYLNFVQYLQARDVDGTGTVVTERRRFAEIPPKEEKPAAVIDGDTLKVDNVDIDENLFDDDDELEELEEEISELNMD